MSARHGKADSMVTTAGVHGTRTNRLARILKNPFVGMSPWIAFSLVMGPWGFETAVGLALALSVCLTVAGHRFSPGTSLKILEVAAIVLFVTLAIVGALAGPGTLRWLQDHAGEVTSWAFVAVAFGSMAVGTPFTLQYAREMVDKQFWNSPTFTRTNYLITGVWGLVFLIDAASRAYGSLVLHDPDNMWTSWIIPLAAIIGAVRFTLWYPDHVRARARAAGPVRP